jgi:hypothetical protein
MEIARRLLFRDGVAHDGNMQVEKNALEVLRDLIEDTAPTLETTPDLPRNRTAHCRENLRVAMALVNDMLRSESVA